MNQHSIEALIAPMIAAMQETIRHMSELAKEIDNQQKRLHIQNNLNGLSGQLKSIDLDHLASSQPGAMIPIFMETLGHLKNSINTLSNRSKRRILLEQMGFLTSQFLSVASTMNKVVHPSPENPRNNWGQNRYRSCSPMTRRPVPGPHSPRRGKSM